MGRCVLLFLLASLGACGGMQTPPPVEEETPPIREGEVRETAGEVTVVASSVGLPPENGQLPADVRPLSYALDLAIDPSRAGFAGEITIRAQLDAPRRAIFMHGQGLEVERVVVHSAGNTQEGRWTGADDEGGYAMIFLDQPAEGEVDIQMSWTAPFSRTLDGIYRVAHGDESYVFTQMEPLAARKAFPCFDEPRFKTPFELTVRGRDGDVVSANAPLLETRNESGRKVSRFAATPPIPTYLFALAVGPFDVVPGGNVPAPAGIERESIPFRGLAPKGRGAELAYTMENAPGILQTLETWFGSAYPYAKLDLVAVPDFEAGAMENVGLVTFRDSLLLIDQERSPLPLKRFWAYIVAHELAHMWFGNSVTMGWWDDLWLNEALASWMEHRAVANWRPPYEADVELARYVFSTMDQDSLTSARAIQQPIVSSDDIHNAFDGITYAKGAGVLGMFERYLGEESFQSGIRSYLAAHAGGNATAGDLMGALGAASGRDVATPFQTFLTQPGVPVVSVDVDCERRPTRVTLRQQRYLPAGSSGDAAQRWQVPVCLRFLEDGRATPRESCTLLTEPQQYVELPGRCPDWIHPNASGAGYYRWTLPEAQLQQLRRGLWRLSVAERLSFADSLMAGFASGAIDGGAVVEGLLDLAEDPHHAVGTYALGFLTHVHRSIVDDAHRDRLERRFRSAYQGTYRDLGWEHRGRGEDTEARRLRRGRVVPFMALDVAYNRTRREGRLRGRRYLGFPGGDRLRTDAVSPDLVGTALRVAMEEARPNEARPLFEHMKAKLFASEDGVLRRRLLGAMAAARDPELAEEARQLALAPELRVNEVLVPLEVQRRIPRLRDAAWAWLQANVDAVVDRLPPGAAGGLPLLMDEACDEATAAEVEAFFRPRVGALPGAPRNLAATTERIRLCAAEAAAQRDKVHAWLGG
ncbi:MAG: M1 family metallopeptidase [Myxococcota bacterium]